jgi:hypothetical protein
VDQPTRDDAGQSRDRSHRKIDAPAENDKRHPDRENRIDRHVLDENRQVAPGEKRRRGDGEGGREENQHNHGAQPEQQRRRREPDLPGRCGRGFRLSLCGCHI